MGRIFRPGVNPCSQHHHLTLFTQQLPKNYFGVARLVASSLLHPPNLAPKPAPSSSFTLGPSSFKHHHPVPPNSIASPSTLPSTRIHRSTRSRWQRHHPLFQ